MTESKRLSSAQVKGPSKISEALKSHAKSNQGQRADAKTILLVNNEGVVQEPTT